MNVLIFEPSPDGHRLQFVRACVQAVADLAERVTIVTSRSTPTRDEFRIHLQGMADRVAVDATLPDAGAASPKRLAIDRAAALRQTIARHRPDHVYVPYADGLAQMCGLQRLQGRNAARHGTEIEGILMRGRFAYPHRGWRDRLFARGWLAATSLAPFDILHHLDPIPYDAIIHRGGALAARSRLIPEPVEPMLRIDRLNARRRLGLPLDGRIVCCPGWLDTRKGVDRLIRAFAAAHLRPDDRLLLAGRMEPEIRGLFEAQREMRRTGRMVALEGCLSDEDLHASMCAADVVCVPYPRHIGSSGIIVRAAALERMVLASDFGWVGMVTRRFGLGMTCDSINDGALAQALPAALDASADFASGESAQRFSRFHTQANFLAYLSQHLRERTGSAPSAGLKSWAWVHQAVAPAADGPIDSPARHP